jgi:hypothetical protein
MLSEILKGRMPQMPKFQMPNFGPQIQQMQAPRMDMFGQSNNAGLLKGLMRGMQWQGRI